MRSRVFALAIVLVLSVVVVPSARAGEPTEQVRERVNAILALLKDPRFRQRPAPERHAEIRAVADPIFDWEEMAKRALGPHWQRRTPAERVEFVRLFADVIQRAYIDKIEAYRNEAVQYLGEKVDGDRAIVRTSIASPQGQTVPLDYRMILEGDRWKVYDVDVSGVGLVANYRTQFNTVLGRSSYADLVQRLRSKAGEGQASPRGAR